MISYETAQKRLDDFNEKSGKNYFYFRGYFPVEINRKNYRPEVFDGKKFKGFSK